MSSSDDLKQQFFTELGPHAWNDGWQSLLNLSPALFQASFHLRGVPKRHRYLPPKVQAFIGLAVDSAATHLHVPGIEEHIRTAIASGATSAELVEVIELTSTLGIHACNIGVPLLVEVLKEEGHPAATNREEMDARRSQLQAAFTRNRGYWHTFWEDILRLDPDFFEAYLEFSSVPWSSKTGGKEQTETKGVLEPKVSYMYLSSVPYPSDNR
jgi:alkylhydroperoxidase/carboxymuconolactone decarboxylase family protein YurZ